MHQNQEMPQNPELELALQFIQNTDRNLFLTGKAGTGKTTFLHQIKNESLKRMVIVAPTGVAAINAKGVTIHSFFQMPFGPILPNQSLTSNNPQRKFSKTKIDIIRSLDLVVIDEISMVRADLLDGIDQVLRRYKDRNKVFGGAQMLFIGDLQQLAPVVKPNEWNLLRNHYETMYFFSSKSFQEAQMVSIELKHIYRQENPEFISILNEIRNDTLSATYAEILNKRYNPTFVPKENDGYITLTTHNRRAQSINNSALQELDKHPYYFDATINGKFSESAYPNHERLELKVGAQVMFIKNDSSPEKRYFNGKIGKIIFIEDDVVAVKCPNDDYHIETSFETWENINYSINEDTKERIKNSDDPIDEFLLVLDEFRSLAELRISDDKSFSIPETPVLTECGYTEDHKAKLCRKIDVGDWLKMSAVELEFSPRFYYSTNKEMGDVIPFNDASAGQQATALLTVLLNQSGIPLLIDQPEDDIDNRAIQDIINNIWHAKKRRQLVFTSHNANLVVNGDAELVICCDYKDSSSQTRGVIKAEGAIDTPSVKEEITLVMEGGEKAFRLRKDKYGY